MKKRRLLVLALLVAGGSALTLVWWDALDPTEAGRPHYRQDKAEGQSGRLEDIGESEPPGQGGLQPLRAHAPRYVVVVDEHTGEALGETRVRVDGVDGSEARSTGRVHMSDASGGILLPPGTFRLRPADGFSFVARSVWIDDETREVRLAGQFRVRLSGDRGCRAEIRAVRGQVEPGESTAKPDENLRYASKGEPLDDVDGWQVLPSAEGRYVIVVEGATVSPAHRRWVGVVVTHNPATRTKRFTPPVEGSPPTVSAVFSRAAGASLEFTLEKLSETSTITYEVNYSDGGQGRATLLRIDTVAGGNRVVRPVAQREVGGEDDRVVFEGLRSGTYVVRSAIRYDDAIVVAQQRLEADGNTGYLAMETGGVGPYDLFLEPWVAGLQFMRANAGIARGGVGIKANAIIPLSGVRYVRGLAGPSGNIRTYDERTGDVASFEFDLRNSVFLSR